MKLEQKVCNLALSKILKKLGVKQESLFYWVKGRMNYDEDGGFDIDESDDWFIFDHIVGYKPQDIDFKSTPDEDKFGMIGNLSDENFEKWSKEEKRIRDDALKNVCSAFTVAELGEMLPENIKENRLSIFKINNQWHITYSTLERWWRRAVADTEADARAEMLVYLLENKLIKINEGN